MKYKINILGAGPAGMYAAARLKTAAPDLEIHLYEKLSREQAQKGVGYSFTNDMEPIFSPFNGFLDRLYQGSPTWSGAEVISRAGMVGRETRYTYIGVTRQKLMQEFERLVHSLDIPLTYSTEITSTNFDSFRETDLTLVSTGVKRFLTEQQLKPFRVYEAETTLRYHWCIPSFNVSTLSLFLGKAGPAPYVMSAYPISKKQSAAVVEVFADDVAAFCKHASDLDLHIVPNEFSEVRIRASEFPLQDNVLLLGDAACTRYFGTGNGLISSFLAGKKLTDCVTSPYGGTLKERVISFAQGLGITYLHCLRADIDMIEEKANVLREFDTLSPSEQVRRITGRALPPEMRPQMIGLSNFSSR